VVSVVSLFGFGWCEVVAVLEGPAVVVPVDPFGGGDFEVVEALPRTPRLDQLGLVEPDHGFGQRVVVGRPDGSGRGLDPGSVEVLGIGDGEVLAPVIMMCDQASNILAVALVNAG
jgi:hypothetical protein